MTHVVEPSGFWLTFGYDLADRRTSVTDSAGGDEESTYDFAGQLRRRSAGYGWTDFYYDANGREIVRLQNHKNGEAGPGALKSAPDIVGLVINAGDQLLAGQQRSMVNSVLVVFDRAVTLDAGAFTIKLHGDVTVDDEPGQEVGTLPTLSWATTDGGISWLVTFSGDGVSAGSIAGGVYELKTVHDKVHAGSATMAADRVDTLHRMFGDIDGDGIVDSVDVDAFAAAYDASTGDPNYVRGFDIDLSDSIDDDDAEGIKEKTWTWITGTSQVVAFTVNRFDQAGRTIEQITGDAHENELADYTYTYDIVNRLTQQTHNGVASTFTYDNAGQVTAEANPAGTSSYSFDANGNRTMTGYTTGDGPGGSADDNRLTSDGTWNYTYDLEGNMIRRLSVAAAIDWLYQYDHRNQLVRVDRKTDGTNIDLTVIYTYDAWGNRIAQSIDTDGAGSGSPVITKFAIDGWNPAKFGTIGLSRFDVHADLTASGSLTTRYVHADGVDDLLARIEPGDIEFIYLLDRQGSVRAVVDSTGQIADSIDYDAFGNIISETDPSMRGHYAYAGRRFDIAIGAYDLRAREYGPDIGRMYTKDPIGFQAGDPNVYRYVHNGPTNATDPSGLDRIETDPTDGRVYYVVQQDGAVFRSLWSNDLYRIPIGFAGNAQGISLDDSIFAAPDGDGRHRNVSQATLNNFANTFRQRVMYLGDLNQANAQMVIFRAMRADIPVGPGNEQIDFVVPRRRMPPTDFDRLVTEGLRGAFDGGTVLVDTATLARLEGAQERQARLREEYGNNWYVMVGASSVGSGLPILAAGLGGWQAVGGAAGVFNLAVEAGVIAQRLMGLVNNFVPQVVGFLALHAALIQRHGIDVANKILFGMNPLQPMQPMFAGIAQGFNGFQNPIAPMQIPNAQVPQIPPVPPAGANPMGRPPMPPAQPVLHNAPAAGVPQDINVNPIAPPARPLNRPIGASPTQNAAMQADIAAARAQGATDFRVNQHQVNSAGIRVGINRPDLQYTDANGIRVYVEYDTTASTRGAGHEIRILTNDPNGTVILRRVD